MLYLTIAMLLVGALVLVLGAVLVVEAFIENRREEPASFQDYFRPGYDRDLLRQSDWSEIENWQAIVNPASHPSVSVIPGANKRRRRISCATQQDRESD